MFSKAKKTLLAGLMTLTATQVKAELSFSDILKSISTNQKQSVVSEVPYLDNLLELKTIESAESFLSAKPFISIQDEVKNKISTQQVDALIDKKQITFVIVPGLLGEFIDTRAFEEVFSKKNSYSDDWKRFAGNTMDERYSLKDNANIPEKLHDLINVASMDVNGKQKIKLVILKTQLGSLESVGNNAEVAALFNRRLQKYFEIMNEQNIVLLGYSRGTPLALEMITQAEKQGLSYLQNVKAVISYAGVVMGSSLANSTEDKNSTNGKLVEAVKTLQSELKEEYLLGSNNRNALTKFVRSVTENDETAEPQDGDSQLRQFIMTGDLRSIVFALIKVGDQLGFSITKLADSKARAVRINKFFNEVLASVNGLKTSALTEWWKANTLPKNIQYLSIAAAMEESGYGKSLDDIGLKGNMRTYTKATNGVLLNDSQVAVHQTLFLPSIIRDLNPANDGLQIKQLGLLNTHHWGVSLRVVNKMRLKEEDYINKFPRENVLKAIAAYLNQ